MKILVNLLLLFLCFFVEASSEGGISSFFFPMINFTLFAFLFFYLLRKKGLFFLKRQREDFLNYRQNAKDLKKQNKQSYDSLFEEVKKLEEKEKRIKSDVAMALERLQKELQAKNQEWLIHLEEKNNQEIQRLRFKELNLLKDHFISEIISEAKQKFRKSKMDLQKQKFFFWHMIHELEKIK